ncbi:hypothetical protein HZB08_01345 [Candidatus Saganbacteria bacterium]|uniref:Prepilin-type N-terminal cleavage/methylation domain-containing protein n=1 Tax=Candidatus Saganbacteria bacterium TaxID=2575572 RepID=A0A9D6UKT3_UNCSA|nr:hypothetical protein [Candidatus Saganbacteria bacterium]
MANRRGFTFVELVMVFLAVGVLSVVSMAAIGNVMRGIQLSNATDKLASDLRYAQSSASGTGVWYGVSFEADPVNRYRLYTTDGTTDAVVEDPAKLGNNFMVDLNTTFNVLVSSVSIGGGAKVEFSPLGTPYNDKNGSAISNEGVVTLIRGSSTRTVRVTPNTGRVYIQ